MPTSSPAARSTPRTRPTTPRARCAGLDDVVASTVLGLDAGGLAYWVACARELFEEAGLLLATKRGRRAARPRRRRARRAARRAPRRGERGHAALPRRARRGAARARRHGAVVLRALDHARSARRAATTRGSSSRPRPAGQVPVHDDKELVANTWVTPTEALERHRRGEMQLILPTIKNLEAIERFGSSPALLDAARDAASVPTIEPRIVADGNGVRILLPGDDGFDDASLGDVPARSVGNAAIDRASGDTAHAVSSPDGAARSGDRVRRACRACPRRSTRAVTRVTAPNPSMMTGPGTNTYVVGDDGGRRHRPGPADRLAPRRRALRRRRTPVSPPSPSRTTTATTRPRRAVARRGRRARRSSATATPCSRSTSRPTRGPSSPRARSGSSRGTRPGTRRTTSASSCRPTGWLFTGDHLMQGSTVVIRPPDGDLTAYLASIARVRDERRVATPRAGPRPRARRAGACGRRGARPPSGARRGRARGAARARPSDGGGAARARVSRRRSRARRGGDRDVLGAPARARRRRARRRPRAERYDPEAVFQRGLGRSRRRARSRRAAGRCSPARPAAARGRRPPVGRAR